MEEAGLYVVATPIGNLSDLSRRAVEALRASDAVYAEDTRRTGRLLEEAGVEGPLRSLHEHNEARRVEEVLSRLEAGEAVALVADAGTPGISDPGRRLVEAVLDAGCRVVPVPGPSAVTSALSVAGLPADRFAFMGFPPRTEGEREAWMETLGRLPFTSVVFESPRRAAELLEEWEGRGWGDRACVLCREMTKKFEEVVRSTVRDLRRRLSDGEVRGEVTLVLEGAAEPGPSVEPTAVRAAALALLEAGWSTRDVGGHLQDAYGLSRNEAYELALELQGEDG